MAARTLTTAGVLAGSAMLIVKLVAKVDWMVQLTTLPCAYESAPVATFSVAEPTLNAAVALNAPVVSLATMMYEPRASCGTVNVAVAVPLALVTNGSVKPVPGTTTNGIPNVEFVMKKLTVAPAPKFVSVKATPDTPTGAVDGFTVRVEVAVTTKDADADSPKLSVTTTL